MKKRKVNMYYVFASSALGLCFTSAYTNAGFLEQKFISVFENLKRESVHEITLNYGENLPDLTNNPNGYSTIKVVTNGNKVLDATDFSRLKSSKIPNIDLSEAKADSIPRSAFEGRTWLKKFIYPKGVASVGDYAFYGCSGLTGDLIIPDSVTTLGTYAFTDCSGFNGKLVIGNSVKSIPEGAFSGCSNLTGDLIIPDSVTSIYTYEVNVPSRPFYGCTKLTGNLIVGKNLELGVQYTFAGTSLTGDLIIGEGRTSIPENSFRGLSNFKGNLVIPNSVTTIEEYAFYECSGFTGDLIIGKSVESIGSRAFYGCSGFTGELIMPETLISIGEYAFFGCSGFTGDLVIPDSVTTLGTYVFYNCSGFNGKLVIGNSVKSIPQATFSRCSNLTGDLIIPDSVTSIYTYETNESLRPFYGCTKLRGNLVVGKNVQLGSQYTFAGTSLTGDLIIGEGRTSIPGNSFRGLSNFKGNLVIPNSVTSIGTYAFSGCVGFTGDLIIGKSVESIGSSAFYGCSGFTGDLIMPETLISIGSSAFNGCSGFTGDLVIPDSVTTLGTYAFTDCSGFNGKLVIGNSVKSIPQGAFSGCSNLTGDLIIPDSVTSIYTYEVNNSIRPFYGCTKLRGNLVVGKGVELGNKYTFAGISLTGDLIIGEGRTSIPENSFRGLSNFKGNLVIPNSVTSIGTYAFSGCVGFTGDLIIGRSLNSIGNDAFYDVNNVKRIIIATGSDFSSSNYRKAIIDQFDKTKLVLDLPYDFDYTGTWIETDTTIKKVRPSIKKVIDGQESDFDFDTNPFDELTLSIEVPYNESDIVVDLNSEIQTVPEAIDGKHNLKFSGLYNLTIKTLAGAISNITFTLEGYFDYTEIEEAIAKAEASLDITDISIARELLNKAPEGDKKKELEIRLNVLIPSFTIEKQTTTSNTDIYIKPKAILSMSLNTNSITFEDFDSVEDMEKENAINITINSNLPYSLNAYLESDISNSDNSQTMNSSILNIKESGESNYQKFTSPLTKLILKGDNIKGENTHSIDLKLSSDKIYKTDVYKAVIKFEAEQK